MKDMVASDGLSIVDGAPPCCGSDAPPPLHSDAVMHSERCGVSNAELVSRRLKGEWPVKSVVYASGGSRAAGDQASAFEGSDVLVAPLALIGIHPGFSGR
jgi:hypothetical protein